MFTPRRDGRLSLPLRANVRVGPPAMSSSVRSFLRQHFCGSIYKDTMKTEIALAPKTSQRPTEGAFFSSESAEKNRTGWSAKACLNRSARKPILPDGRPKRDSNSSEVFTPRRDGRRSLPLRANVRVGPPAMSSSIRSFLRQHFCGSIYHNLLKTETALTPKTSQRPTEGAFFSSESAEKNRTGWSAKA